MPNSVRPHRRQPTRLPRPWDSPSKNTGVSCHFLLQCMKVKSDSEVSQSCLTPWTAAYQAPLAMGFSRQEYWSGVPLPSSFSHSIVFLYFFALIAEEGFLISPCYSLELCIQMGISLLFFFCFTSLLFIPICKASSDSHFAFFAFLFLGDGLVPCLLYNVMNLHP